MRKIWWPSLALLAITACSTPRTVVTPPEQTPEPTKPVPMSAIHQNISDIEAAWHVRAGLNVAALSCSGQVGPSVVENYNKFLKTHHSILSKAYEAETAKFKSNGANWQRDLDRYMTQLYNHFASPTAQVGFCAAAANQAQILSQSTIQDVSWARPALAALDAPFTAPVMMASRTMAARSAPMSLAAVAPAAAPTQVLGALVNWRIQLGAFSSAEAAKSAWSKIQARSSEIGRMKPHYEAVSGKTLTRLQVKDVKDKGAAIQLCALASSAGFDCMPVRGN